MVVLKKFYTKHITKKYINWLNDKQNLKYTSIKKINQNDVIKYVKRHQYNNKEKLYRIIYNNKHIGNLRIHYLDKSTATIGILIGEKKFHSKGLGTDSIKQAIKLIKNKNIRNIKAYVHIKNIISLKIFKKNNFRAKKINNDILLTYKIKN